MDRFDAMRLFARIVELGSFSRAAEQLGLPRASATLTIQRLEARLGARLLARTTRHVRPTADGSAYYERCVAILAELEDAESVFLDAARKPQGRVRVDAEAQRASTRDDLGEAGGEGRCHRAPARAARSAA